MKEKELETTNLQAFLSYKKELIEAGKLILSPALQEELGKEPDELWQAYIKAGYSPVMAVAHWRERVDGKEEADGNEARELIFLHEHKPSGIGDQYGVYYSRNGKRLLSCENRKLKKYVVKAGTESIRYNAFCDRGKLKSIVFPEGLKSIECGAFAWTKLTSVTLPESLQCIEGDAFAWSKLTSVTLPDNLQRLGLNAFSYCFYLREFVVSEDSERYRAIEGILYSKDLEKLICYPAGKRLDCFEIPSSVTAIGDGAFCGCKLLGSVKIHDNVKSMGENAFGYCKYIREVSIGNGLREISRDAFEYCVSLVSVEIPQSVEVINSRAFDTCAKLIRVKLGNKLRRIHAFAFANCPALTELISLNPVPPVIEEGDDPFFEDDLDKCLLKVPAGSLDAYRAAEGWKEFKNIDEIETEDEDRSRRPD